MVIECQRNMVYVSGSLRGNHWNVIRTSALLVYETHPLGIIIDFSGARWVGPAGESTLTAAINDIEANRMPFVLLNVSPSVEPLLSHAVSQRLAAGCERWWNRVYGAS